MAKKPAVKKQADEAKVTMFDELTSAAGVTVNEGESFQDFAVRLGVTLSELDDNAYGKLSPGAVKWFTAATDAINADKEAPGLDGFPTQEVETEEEVETETEAVDEVEQEVESKAKAKPSVVKKEEVKSKSETKPDKRKAEMAKKVEVKKEVKKAGNDKTKSVVKKTAAAKPKGEKKERAVRTDSVAYKLRVVGVKQPDITFEAACAKAGIKPVEGSHAWNVWYLTKLTMQVVKEVRG